MAFDDALETTPLATPLAGAESAPAHMQTPTFDTISTAGGEDAEALIALKNLEKRRADKRRKKRLRIAAALALVALVGGALAVRGMLSRGSSEDYDTGPELTYVMRQDFSTSVQGSGSLNPYDSVVVTPEVDGYIDVVSVTEGQQVNLGDTLFTIRNDELDKAISEAAAQVASAESAAGEAWAAVGELEQAYADDKASYDAAVAEAEAAQERAAAAGQAAYNEVVGPYQMDLDSTFDALQDAEAKVTDAIRELTKVREDEGTLDQLYKDPPTNEVYDTDFNIADSVQLAAAKRALSDAYLALELAQNQYDNAQTRFKIADEQGETAYQQAYAKVPIPPVPAFSESGYAAQIESARSAASSASQAVSSASRLYDQAVEQASKRTVKAPKSGTLVSFSAKSGAAVGGVSATSGALATIADVSKMKVTIEVNEIDISDIAEGQRARCTFSAVPGLELSGRVVDVASTSSSSGNEGYFGGGGVVTFTVTIVIDKPDARLKPGMTASVTILTQDVPDALVIPAMALLEDGGKSYVEVAVFATDDGPMGSELREVTVGARSASEVVIESGLEEGEAILLTPTGEALYSAVDDGPYAEAEVFESEETAANELDDAPAGAPEEAGETEGAIAESAEG